MCVSQETPKASLCVMNRCKPQACCFNAMTRNIHIPRLYNNTLKLIHFLLNAFLFFVFLSSSLTFIDSLISPSNAEPNRFTVLLDSDQSNVVWCLQSFLQIPGYYYFETMIFEAQAKCVLIISAPQFQIWEARE